MGINTAYGTVSTRDQAGVLAEHLMDPARLRPVVVVTTRGGHLSPEIDVVGLRGELEPHVEVVVITNPTAGWALSQELPEGTSVYGGAARVYPVDLTWLTDPGAAPLHTYSPSRRGDDGGLVADARSAAVRAGLLSPGPAVVFTSTTSTAPVNVLEDDIDELWRRIHELEGALAAKAEALAAATRERQALAKRERVRRAAPASDPAPGFLDPVAQFVWEVRCRWVERIPAGEKATRPLGRYRLGPAFLGSVESVEGVGRQKVVDVVVEVATGLVKEQAGRELHRLRTGVGGDDKPVVRDDGAICWRVALQRGSPSARRLHYWQLSDGSVELSRVVTHDDVLP